jgi:hypothetical protein
VYTSIGVVSLLFGVITLAGGACMLGLKLWGLGVFASILALIAPGGCCIFGLVAGIWGLVTLLNENVRAAYRWASTWVGSFVLGVLTGVLAFPVLIGGTAMLRSRGYFAAAIAALLALVSPGGFCLLGLVAGIWALAVRFNGEVRRSFR